jgi:hypothetical protein
MKSVTAAESLERLLADSGYAFVHASTMREALEASGPLSDWPTFAASWDDLELDHYLAERDRCRRRRFAVYAIAANGAIERQAHAPHYQQPDYNSLFGGVERWFAPIVAEIGGSPTMHTILRFCHRLCRRLAPAVETWHVEAHQFRIEARTEAPGHPTPEGVHRDGVDFALVLLVNRVNIVSGRTTVYDLAGPSAELGAGPSTGLRAGRPLGSFTLTDPLDAALVDDNRVAHGVTPVAPLDPTRPGHRDVLVVTFRRRGSAISH